ncbi:MAG: GH12 family glycosyl hydrolase domain-containing protein [Polyangiaceae bacterium]
MALWVAACAVGGCSVERVTAVELADSGTGDVTTSSGGGGSGGNDGASDDGASGEGADGSSSGGESGISSSTCRAPFAYTISGAVGQVGPDDGYFIRSDAWNGDASPGPQTLYICSYDSWYVVVANEPDTSEVKAYPDVQMDFQESGAGDGTGVPLSSYSSITSTFAEKGPPTGAYEFAYDMFVNSNMIIGQGTVEIMIWVDIHDRTPRGSLVAPAVSLDTRAYDVYYEPADADAGGAPFIAFVVKTSFNSGTVDILKFLAYAMQQNWIPMNAPLNQIAFGVEISETSGPNAEFDFTNFSITAMLAN